jgi:hypothetical protein
MQPVSTDFTDRTFRYTHIERHGDVAIYAQTHKVSQIQRFEVVIIRKRSEKTWPDGSVTPPHEAYPSASAWGSDGFTFYTLTAAQAFAATLTQVTNEVVA